MCKETSWKGPHKNAISKIEVYKNTMSSKISCDEQAHFVGNIGNRGQKEISPTTKICVIKFEKCNQWEI